MNKLQKILGEYLTIRRSLGFELRDAEALLRKFIAYLKKKKCHHIKNELTMAFVTKNPKAAPSWQAHNLRTIRLFALYLQVFDKKTEIPPKELLSFSYHRRPPFIFEDDDIIHLLKAFQGEGTFEMETYFVLFGLIAVTGMRTSEAYLLKNSSIDLKQGIINIHESKNHKSRRIPIRPSVVKALKRYTKLKNHHLHCITSDYFFVQSNGSKLNLGRTRRAFKRACTLAEIGKGAMFCPRITDLRHYFAVKTMVNCHKEGVNPETIIPVLSMYLGHENPKHTYWYLTTTEELMTLIEKRTEKIGGNL